MVAKIIFFVFPLLLILLPLLLYRKYKPPYIIVWLRLAFDNNARKMATNITQLVLIFFHVTYFAVFPEDYGFIFSSFIVFFMFATKTTVRLMLATRRNKVLYRLLAIASVALLFAPHAFSTSFSLALILECATFFPSKESEDFQEKHLNEEGMDKKFVDSYFS
ncbi:MAG: hypothetical protein VZQ98_13800 [Bacteroidales bacterium]|jgi:hypothetical protein|nr:hypothetical protein [Bacteroidales bacterium]